MLLKKWPFLLFLQLLQSNKRLPCKFGFNRCNTASLQSISSSIVAKTPKTHFCDVVWPKTYFFSSKWSILLFAHFLQLNSRLSCKFELNRSNTASLRSLFLKYCRKNPQKTRFCDVVWPKTYFFQAKWSFLLFGHLLSSNERLPCKFKLNRSITAILPSVFLKYYRKTLKNTFFRGFLAKNLICF